MDEKRKRIEQLVAELNRASEAYYGKTEEIMSNYEWDALFDELSRLEDETGYVLPDSPTQTVSEEKNSGGAKEAHEYPALSLAKTKKIEELQKWAGDRPIWVSWKLDGLTVVLTYDGGALTRILTRGNGAVGSNITYMKDALRGVPSKIAYHGHLVVRGEATISYPDFERINDTEDDDEKYANPRNLASGTLALDAKNIETVRSRSVTVNAFTLVHLDEPVLSWGGRMDFLDQQGFITVEREKTDAEHLPDVIDRWTKKVESGEMQIPVDGLVIAFDDTDYASTGSVTGHHATRAGLAFKWQDESAVSRLDHIEWSCAASTITPIAVFDPVQLEGTKVSRASLCNISELERLGIGENGKTQLRIIKSNKIIPKCIEVVEKEGTWSIPECCPVCREPVELHTSAGGTRTLRCTNAKCPAKELKKFTRFVSKQGMDIDGLSVETLRDFINAGMIRDYADIFSIPKHEARICEMDGYGKRSFRKLADALQKSRSVNPANLMNALNIPLIGTDTAKKMISATGWQGFLERLSNGSGFEDVEGIGKERSASLMNWYAQEENRAVFEKLLNLLRVENIPAKKDTGGTCSGLTFVITGDVNEFKNRDEFKAYVEQQGGKVSGSVSSKTDFLVNNDLESGSSKNKKAKELSVPIISEQEFISRFGKG